MVDNAHAGTRASRIPYERFCISGAARHKGSPSVSATMRTHSRLSRQQKAIALYHGPHIVARDIPFRDKFQPTEPNVPVKYYSHKKEPPTSTIGPTCGRKTGARLNCSSLMERLLFGKPPPVLDWRQDMQRITGSIRTQKHERNPSMFRCSQKSLLCIWLRKIVSYSTHSTHPTTHDLRSTGAEQISPHTISIRKNNCPHDKTQQKQ